jgi:hypothetical protein
MKKIVSSMVLVGMTGFSFAAALFISCGSPDQLGGGGGGGGGVAGSITVKLDGSPPGQQGGSSGGGSGGPLPTGDANCGSVTSSANHIPADVLLVLDRSGSMDYSTTSDQNCNNDPNCTPRWPAVTSAVDATLTSTSGSINWGLKLYSSTGNGCTVNSGVEVQISTSSVSAIQNQINRTSPGGNTPTAQAIEAATTYYKGVNDGNNHVILLATDGEPNCKPGESNSTTNVPGTVDAITAAAAAGYPVYVIGIGPSVGNLDNFAVAGGTGHYYPASSPEELASAFASISQLVTTCTFALSLAAGADLDNVAVYLDKHLVQKDGTNGWSFGANNQTVVLNGTTCESVKSGAATLVEILVGCAGGPPPPQTIP